MPRLVKNQIVSFEDSMTHAIGSIVIEDTIGKYSICKPSDQVDGNTAMQFSVKGPEDINSVRTIILLSNDRTMAQLEREHLQDKKCFCVSSLLSVNTYRDKIATASLALDYLITKKGIILISAAEESHDLVKVWKNLAKKEDIFIYVVYRAAEEWVLNKYDDTIRDEFIWGNEKEHKSVRMLASKEELSE